MMDEKRSQELAAKWLNGTITEEEKSEFAKWYNSHDDTHFYTAVETEAILKDRMFNRIVENTHALDERAESGKKINWKWQLGIAASLLICFSAIFYHSFNRENNVVANNHKVPTLTLANGQTIELNRDQKGIVVGSDVKYLNGKSVAVFNKNTVNKLTLTTPKGLIYLITLPDGSKVTLNAGSTLIYPSEFSANERLVELEGEAFFEVTKVYRDAANTSAKKAKQPASHRVPFKVKTAGQTVEVLGTRFNVSAYRGDQITQTTLIEGLVRVAADNSGKTINKHTVMLSPGQQAQSGENGISVRSVDTEPFTAWKEGYFYFENASVPMVMTQMQRWYGFDLSYEAGVPDKLFFGKIQRNISLQEALKILKKAGINTRFTAENEILILSPNKKINN